MSNLKFAVLGTSLALSLAALACGGDNPPAKAPESTAGITEQGAKEDMPAPPTKEADATKAADDKAAADKASTEKAAPSGMIALAAIKITPKKGKAVELKADGNVNVDGKPLAKIAGDQVNDVGGPTLLTVGVDGGLVGSGVKGGPKFQGDELVLENGNKLSVADDGTLNLVKADGKTEALAKTDGGAAQKRTTLILAALWLLPADAAKAPAAGKAGTPAKTDAKSDAKPTSAAPAEKKAPAKK